MKDLNTKTIINFLPFEPSFKLKLLENYDAYPLPEQIRITRLVWGFFNSIYDLRIKRKFEDGLKDQPNNAEDGSYYLKILEEVRNEINEELENHQTSADISEVRKSMEQIVREINALKTQSPAPKSQNPQ